MISTILNYLCPCRKELAYKSKLLKETYTLYQNKVKELQALTAELTPKPKRR